MLKKQKIGTEFDKSVQTYLKEISKYPTLSQKDELDLWTKYKYKGDIKAKEKLVTSNLKFVASVARSYQGRGLSYSDLIAEGNMGLIRGIEKFDGTKGFKVISYSVWWIKQSIREALAERNCSENEDLPDDNVNPDLETNDDDNLDAAVETPYICNTENEEHHTAKEKVGFLMNFLSDREKFIVNNYWGLNGEEPMTLEDIGAELNLTKERVRQINSKVLTKMRSLSLSFSDSSAIYEI